MIAFEENLIALLDSIEDCLAKRRLLLCLILLYSGIDIVSALEHEVELRTRYPYLAAMPRL